MDERMVSLTAKDIFRIINFQSEKSLIFTTNKKLQRTSYITYWKYLQSHNPIWCIFETFLQDNPFIAGKGEQQIQLQKKTPIEWRNRTTSATNISWTMQN